MNKLTAEEIEFLLSRIADHRRYYGGLAASPRCGEYSKSMWALVNSVANKLETAKFLEIENANSKKNAKRKPSLVI